MKKERLIKWLLLFACMTGLEAGVNAQSQTSVFVGIEYIELAQNSFMNLGPQNYTAFAGFSHRQENGKHWGFHLTSMNVELSEKHLREPSPAYKGDFTGVTGNLNVQRLYADYYHRWVIKKLWIEPIVSLGLGYNHWSFHNRMVQENYDLKAVSLSVSGRFRFTLFGVPFIEIPAIDLMGYLYKNRDPEQMLGDAHLDFWKHGAIFNWIFLGVNVPLSNRK